MLTLSTTKTPVFSASPATVSPMPCCCFSRSRVPWAGRWASPKRCLPSPATRRASPGPAAAKGQLGLQFAADNKTFGSAGIPWADFERILFINLSTDVRHGLNNSADLHGLLATFRQQAGVPAIRRNGTQKAERVVAYFNSRIQQTPSLAVAPLIRAYLAATTDAARQAAIAANPPDRFDDATLGQKLDGLRAVKTPRNWLCSAAPSASAPWASTR